MSFATFESQPISQVSLKKVMAQTFKGLFYPQVLLLLFLPLLISFSVVAILLVLTWGFWSGLFTQGLVFVSPFWQTFLDSLPLLLAQIFQGLAPLLPILFFMVLFAFAFPILVVLNLVLTSLVASHFLVQLIARHDFPELSKKGRPRVAQGIWKTLRTCFIYLFVWVLTFPLWLLPLVQLILPILLTAWFNRQICMFDALTDFADEEELQVVIQKSASRGYILGMMTAGLNYIPFALFLSPILTMLAFTYLGLGNLRLHRSE